MTRVLIVGSGDLARRILPLLHPRYRIYALIRDAAKAAPLRALGATPILGDLDDRRTLSRLRNLGDLVLHFAPPPRGGTHDTRTRHLLATLSQGRSPRQLIYISTSGVYGDCAGEWVSETRPLRPQTERAALRVEAERQLRHWARRQRVQASILRAPGIIAHDRLPLERIRSGAPAIVGSEDGYSNHIHADDLARVVLAALRRGRPNRVYHAVNDDQMKMGDYFDTVADAYGLPRPPRLARAEVQQRVPPMMWTFLNESRRLANRRMKDELHVRLRYPTLHHLLGALNLVA